MLRGAMEVELGDVVHAVRQPELAERTVHLHVVAVVVDVKPLEWVVVIIKLLGGVMRVWRLLQIDRRLRFHAAIGKAIYPIPRSIIRPLMLLFGLAMLMRAGNHWLSTFTWL